jgi:hypothetical protein
MMKVLTGTIIAVWIYRWVAVLWMFNGTYVFGAFETRADALAIGCLPALYGVSSRCQVPPVSKV